MKDSGVCNFVYLASFSRSVAMSTTKFKMVATKELSVFGLLKCVDFHRACGMVEELSKKKKDQFKDPVSKGMLECDWVAFVESKRKNLGGELWSFSADVMIFDDDDLIGDFERFLKWAEKNYQYTDYRPLPLWHAMAKEKYKAHLLETQHEFVYLSIQIASEPAGRLLIELYTDRCPKTCSNFKTLCVGGLAESEKHDPPLQLTYKNSIFHRIVPKGWIQGGGTVKKLRRKSRQGANGRLAKLAVCRLL